MATLDAAALAPYLDRLHQLPYVRDIEWTARSPTGVGGPEAVLTIETPQGEFSFALEVKRTYLDRTTTNALIAAHGALVREHELPLLLLARYIPRPTGERLAEAGVNFADGAGNLRLALGDDYHALLLGRREPATEATARRVGPAQVQLYFAILAEPAAVGWPVRRLAEAAGIGKTTAATGLRRLRGLGVVGREDGRYRVADHKRLEDEFLRGYGEVLRPHLQIGRFQAPESDPERFLKRLEDVVDEPGPGWAATGGPAAFRLDRFYQGDETPVFVEGHAKALQRTLRLVPDLRGPITLLRAFGQHWTWREVEGVPITHPWLIYAELLYLGDPRALEAATLIRERFLST